MQKVRAIIFLLAQKRMFRRGKRGVSIAGAGRGGSEGEGGAHPTAVDAGRDETLYLLENFVQIHQQHHGLVLYQCLRDPHRAHRLAAATHQPPPTSWPVTRCWMSVHTDQHKSHGHRRVLRCPHAPTTGHRMGTDAWSDPHHAKHRVTPQEETRCWAHMFHVHSMWQSASSVPTGMCLRNSADFVNYVQH